MKLELIYLLIYLESIFKNQINISHYFYEDLSITLTFISEINCKWHDILPSFYNIALLIKP